MIYSAISMTHAPARIAQWMILFDHNSYSFLHNVTRSLDLPESPEPLGSNNNDNTVHMEDHVGKWPRTGAD